MHIHFKILASFCIYTLNLQINMQKGGLSLALLY